MLCQGVTPVTVFPQHFPECLLFLSFNIRNHSPVGPGWPRPGKGMRETLPRLSLPLPPALVPPGHLASAAHPMMAHHWSRRLGGLRARGRCWPLGGAWDSFVTIQTRNNDFLKSLGHTHDGDSYLNTQAFKLTT